jgi:hypothetical protein
MTFVAPAGAGQTLIIPKTNKVRSKNSCDEPADKTVPGTQKLWCVVPPVRRAFHV